MAGLSASAPRRPSRERLLWPFVLMGLATLAVTGFSIERNRDVERHAELVVNNVLSSVVLVDRMNLDVARERSLIDEMLYEKDPTGLAALETERDEVAADLERSAKAYEPLVDLPGETQGWTSVKIQLAELERPLERVLLLARQNRRTDAQGAMVGIRPGLHALQLDLDKLVAVNKKAADQGLARIRSIQAQLNATYFSIGIAMLAAISAMAVWSLRQVRRRDELAARELAILERRNKDLDAFAGRVAHDIRGPLGTISLATSRLGPEQGKTADILRRGVQRMQAVVDDLLVLARVEALHGSSDPAVAASDLQQELAGRVEAEHGTLSVVVEHGCVHSSDGLLREVLGNLVDNSLKYRRPDRPPRIEITGSVEDAGYELQVSDNGLGMSAGDAARVFEPFFRAEQTSELPGTGLGLSIVKRVVDASGGTIRVETEPGEGTRFRMRLPIVSETGPGGADPC